MTSRQFLQYVSEAELTNYVGFHGPPILSQRIAYNQTGVNEADRQFKQSVKTEVERLSSGIADYDTGYQYIALESNYEIKHNLGQIPSRVSCFMCDTDRPVDREDVIYSVVPFVMVYYDTGATSQYRHCGFVLRHDSSIKTTVITPANHTDDDYVWFPYFRANGYLRVMMWR
jgi:hypothetical protein